MNVLAAPFLYTLPSEIEAFYCFSAFIEECCPLYVSPTLKGVHDGLAVRTISLPLGFVSVGGRTRRTDFDAFRFRQLLDKCLNALDPELYDYLRKKNLSAELYAFPCTFLFLLLLLLSFSNPKTKSSTCFTFLRLAAVLTLCACTPPFVPSISLIFCFASLEY